MNTKIKVRHAAMAIMPKMSELQWWLQMDLAMDGSGDCAGFIYAHHNRTVKEYIDKILKSLDLSAEVFEDTLRQWCLRDAQNGPKTVWIGYTKKDGMRKVRDFIDTFYADLYMQIGCR